VKRHITPFYKNRPLRRGYNYERGHRRESIKLKYLMLLLRKYRLLSCVRFKWIVSRDFNILFLVLWIDLKVVIEPDQVYFSLAD
jgi:hypothetical protein